MMGTSSWNAVLERLDDAATLAKLDPDVHHLLRKPRRPEVLPHLTLSLGLQRAPESWRDYLLWDVSLDQA